MESNRGAANRRCQARHKGQQHQTARELQQMGWGSWGGSHNLAKRNKIPCETSLPLWQLQGRLSRALSPTGAQQSTLCCQDLGWRCKRFSCSCGQGAEPGRCSRECRGFFVSARTEAPVKLSEPFPSTHIQETL